MTRKEIFIERVRWSFEQWMLAEGIMDTSEMTLTLQYKDGRPIVKFN